MEFNVNDYVRTKNGKIWIIKSQKAISGHKKDIIKSSPRIIDLIEEGDYINGCLVTYVDYNEEEDMVEVEIFNPFRGIKEDLYEEEIKSIVTKEQFENISYKAGE